MTENIYCADETKIKKLKQTKTGKTLDEKLGLAGENYEAVQAVPEIVSYIQKVGWDAITKQEQEIQDVLLDFLRSKPDVIKIYGEPSSDRKLRVPVIAFRIKGHKSLAVTDAIEAKSPYGCRSGHFYSKRLLEEVIGLSDPDDGIVRCSLLHYNTKEEVQGLVDVLKEIIEKGEGRVPEDEYRKLAANW